MAVTTRINDFPTWYGSSNKPSVFGYPVPDNVKIVDHSVSAYTDAVMVSWTNNTAPSKYQWHSMELFRPVTEEQITALLVAMKLSC